MPKARRMPRSDGKWFCTKCEQWLPVDEFYLARGGAVLSWCNGCRNGAVAKKRTSEREITAKARSILRTRQAHATWREIGAEIGVSRQRAEQIAITALVKLIKHMERNNSVARDFF